MIMIERTYECTNGIVEKIRFPYKEKAHNSTKHLGKSSVKKQTENDKLAAKRLARILNCNFVCDDRFITLRYSDDGLVSLGSSQDEIYEAAKKEIQLFIRRLKRMYPGLKYAYVTAQHKMGDEDEDTRIHHHLVLPATCKLEDIKKAWSKNGDVDQRKLRDQYDYTPIAVYMVMQSRSKISERKYATAQNMAQPSIVDIEVDFFDEIKVDPQDCLLERSHYDPIVSLVQYVRYKRYDSIRPAKNIYYDANDQAIFSADLYCYDIIGS